jgi:hypothetical protein
VTRPDLRHPIDAIARAHAATLTKALSERTYARGLAVTQKDGSTRPIPTTVTPKVVEASEIRRACELSAHLATGGAKLARAVIDSPARELLLGCMGALERGVIEKTYAHLERLAICRTDFFVTDRPLALELNATIPAMPGYSDIAAHGYIEELGHLAGLSEREIAGLVAKNGSNTEALYSALIDGFTLEKGRPPERIAILTRRNDAQLTELGYLARTFGRLGTEAEVVFPDELTFEGAVRAHGKTFDMVYRHLFVKRLEEFQAPHVLDFLSRTRREAVLLNPPAAQIETKTNFALLSQAASDPELARSAKLTEAELSAVREAVPWTRMLRHYPGVDPDGKKIADIAEYVSEHPERFVLKRAWEYGGKAVFVGRSANEESYLERVRATYGTALGWRELVMRAADDLVGGGFVVQEVVVTEREQHLLAAAEGARETLLYVDFSAYASVGLSRQPAWGAVCRGSVQQIVNIVGGGGVVPLLTREVADRLVEGMEKRGAR